MVLSTKKCEHVVYEVGKKTYVYVSTTYCGLNHLEYQLCSYSSYKEYW